MNQIGAWCITAAGMRVVVDRMLPTIYMAVVCLELSVELSVELAILQLYPPFFVGSWVAVRTRLANPSCESSHNPTPSQTHRAMFYTRYTRHTRYTCSTGIPSLYHLYLRKRPRKCHSLPRGLNDTLIERGPVIHKEENRTVEWLGLSAVQVWHHANMSIAIRLTIVACKVTHGHTG